MLDRIRYTYSTDMCVPPAHLPSPTRSRVDASRGRRNFLSKSRSLMNTRCSSRATRYRLFPSRFLSGFYHFSKTRSIAPSSRCFSSHSTQRSKKGAIKGFLSTLHHHVSSTHHHPPCILTTRTCCPLNFLIRSFFCVFCDGTETTFTLFSIHTHAEH